MKELKENHLIVRIFETRSLMGEEAARTISEKIAELLQTKEQVNIVFAAAPSQNEFLASLQQQPVRWDRINAFHMDEYVGVDKDAPQLFANYLKENLFDNVSCREVHYMNGNNEDLEQECNRYAELLKRYPTDIVILGIGENTHIAFNDPHVADFNDPKLVKIVDLDEKNRRQQVDPDDKYCFVSLDKVPTHAITLTVPALLKATFAYAIAPGKNKADAIYHTVRTEVQEHYPSTILRNHEHTIVFVDKDSAEKL
jgi:glucosamine-6-phosphate deaminase